MFLHRNPTKLPATFSHDDSAKRTVLKPRVLPEFPSDITEEHKDVAMVFRNVP
jgi:hypothetical protein